MACSLAVFLLGGLATAQTPAPYPAGNPSLTTPPPPVPFGVPPRTNPAAAPSFSVPGQTVSRQQKLEGAPLAESGDTEQIPRITAIQLEPPGLERIAQAMQSDEQLQERIRQENREREPMERVTFPPDPVLSRDTYHGRKWDPMKLEVAPYYVCHGRLYFQQINAERYGWDLGVLHPVISGLAFLYDFVMLPYHIAMEPCRCFEYNTGWCLPGDQVPLMIYPFQLSATGFVAEVGTIVALVAIFP
jgi:hypothetical protein